MGGVRQTSLASIARTYVEGQWWVPHEQGASGHPGEDVLVRVGVVVEGLVGLTDQVLGLAGGEDGSKPWSQGGPMQGHGRRCEGRQERSTREQRYGWGGEGLHARLERGGKSKTPGPYPDSGARPLLSSNSLRILDASELKMSRSMALQSQPIPNRSFHQS